ncbi:MAG: CoA transferase [Actinobacteria bacterium]|nr:CoA transferase [Actinomycetota bacterium]
MVAVPVPSPSILDGVTVVELAEGIAGPYCGQILSDLGARVIKVEPPAGDWTRALTTEDGSVPLFVCVNRGKESLAANIRDERGRDVVRRLVAAADVFVEAYRPGVAERNGLGHETLLALDPRLVYCSISGFGARGPLRELPGTDTILQAFSGIQDMTGEPDRAPVRVGTAIADTGAGAFAALGILALLVRRAATGRGGRCDTSLLEVLLGLQTTTFADLFAGVETTRLGTRSSPTAAPAGSFATQDGYIAISCAQPRQWEKLCAALGQPALATDPRFAENAGRVANYEALVAELETLLAVRPTAEWSVVFEREGVNATPVNTVAEVAAHRHVEALGILRRLDSERWTGAPTVVDTPLTFDGAADAPPPRDPPQAGEQTRAVLTEIGFGEGEIDDLLAAGAVCEPARDAETTATTRGETG